MGRVYATIIRDRDGGAGLDDRTPIRRYGLQIEDRPPGQVELHSGPKPAVTGVEMIDLEEDCVAALLAQAVGSLASGSDGGEIDEPPFEQPPGKYRSAGIVLVDERGQLTIREPANHFGGYVWSYAKGRIVGHVTRFYVGVPTGGEKKPSDETWEVESVGPLTALTRLNKQRDKDVLVRLVEIAAGIAEWRWTLGGHPMRCRLIDGQIRAEREAPSHPERPHDL